MKTAGRENPNRRAIVPSNRAHGATAQNRSRLIKWAAEQENIKPLEMCFFLTPAFIELDGVSAYSAGATSAMKAMKSRSRVTPCAQTCSPAHFGRPGMSGLKLLLYGAAMTSPFSRMMDHAVDANFRKDPSGRLVFIPSGPKGKGYFVDSKSDEEKIRALVKMYRSTTTVITFLTSPSIFVPALILDDYAGMTPREHRLAIAFGVPLFFWLVLVSLIWMLWSLYKAAIPSLTSSLGEVGPDVMDQLLEISQPSRRLPLLVIGAVLVLIALALFAFLVPHHFRG